MQAPRWEYQTIKLDVAGFLRPKIEPASLTQQLNELGDLGWELVGMADLNAGEGRTTGLVAVFKRPRN
jgi:hypothetical protein